MQWSMPFRTLQLVAALLGLVAATAFALGVINAQPRGARLPGEPGASAPAETVEATEATPLAEERIEGAPVAPEPTPEELAKLEAEKKAKADAEAIAKAAAEQAALKPPTAAPATPPAGDRLGDLLDSVTPPPEEPPY